MKFNKIVRLEFGVPGKEGIEISGLKIEFRITKTETSDPNTAIITIYNLNSNSRSKISEKDVIVKVFAGYTEEKGDELIFTGSMSLINHEVIRPNIVTTIEAGDGEKLLTKEKIAISFTEGASIHQILQKVLKSVKLPIKTEKLLEPLKNIKFNNGLAFMGKLKTLLDTIFMGVGMDWSIQNNEIKFYKSNSSDQLTAFVLSPETGLIGSPKKIKIKKSKQDDSESIDGWEFKTLLEPGIEPGNLIYAQSREIPELSKFKAISVVHTGDSIGSESTSTIEAMSISS